LEGEKMTAHLEVDGWRQMKAGRAGYSFWHRRAPCRGRAAKAGAKRSSVPDGNHGGLDRRRLRQGAVLKAAREALADGEPRRSRCSRKTFWPNSRQAGETATACASPPTCGRAGTMDIS